MHKSGSASSLAETNSLKAFLQKKMYTSQQRRQWLSIVIFLVSLFFNIHTSYGEVGIAALYSPPYLPTACYGSNESQFPSTNLFAAASDAIWANGTACGRLYLVECIASTSTPYACNQNQTIQIKIVGYIGQEAASVLPAYNTTLFLSPTAFGTIANSSTPNIKIEFQQYEVRPINPNREGRKNQSLSNSTFSALAKEQYVPNKGENSRGPPVLYSPPSHMGNHDMSSSPRVHGDDQYVPLNKGPVPPSAPNPATHDSIGNP